MSVDRYFTATSVELCECADCGLRYYAPITEADEEFYTSLQAFDWYYSEVKEEYAWAADYIRPSDRVLEIGAGKGAFADYIPSAKYVGLEFSGEAKKMAAARGVEIQNLPIEAYARDNPDCFDVVCAFQVLEHVSDPHSFITGCVEATAPGGLLLFATPAEDSLAGRCSNNTLNLPPHHLSRWPDSTLRSIATIFGLDVVELRHGIVDPVHKEWLQAEKVREHLLGRTPKLVELGLRARLLAKAFQTLGRFAELAPDEPGHTVMIALRKPSH